MLTDIVISPKNCPVLKKKQMRNIELFLDKTDLYGYKDRGSYQEGNFRLPPLKNYPSPKTLSCYLDQDPDTQNSHLLQKGNHFYQIFVPNPRHNESQICTDLYKNKENVRSTLSQRNLPQEKREKLLSEFQFQERRYHQFCSEFISRQGSAKNPTDYKAAQRIIADF